jgi:hypothetical protein
LARVGSKKVERGFESSVLMIGAAGKQVCETGSEASQGDGFDRRGRGEARRTMRPGAWERTVAVALSRAFEAVATTSWPSDERRSERGESMAAWVREGVMRVCARCGWCVRAVVVAVRVQVSVASDGKEGKRERERAGAQILVPGSPRGRPSRSQRPAISAGHKPCRVAQSQHSTARLETKSRSGFTQRARQSRAQREESSRSTRDQEVRM